MASPPILLLLSLFSLISFASSLSPISLPISPLHSKHPSSSDPFHNLKLAASSSLSRAHHLKHRKSKSNPNSSNIKTPDSPKSYGGYSVDLSFGTPPQTFPFVLDTGSSLVWFPCSSHYLCSRCSFPNIDSSSLPKFIPKNSSTAKFVGCRNPKCSWIFGPDLQSRCQQCQPTSQNCSQICPTYIIQYGSGTTAGFLLSDNLDLNGKIVPDFLVGCSIMSIRQPAGIAGFGRGSESLPSQLGLKKFSYCLISHRFDDDTSESSDLILQSESSGDTKTGGLSYTPFQKNPAANNSAFQEYYYLTIRKIIIGGELVKIPSKLFEPDLDGNGGVIVDSGSTFTFMEKPIYDMVAQEFERQMANYTRAKEVETQSGLSPCFDFTGLKSISFPEFTIKFRGGANMTLPLENYFSLVDASQVACLTIVSDNGSTAALSRGPAVILGNYQQQNFYVEYDLENERFGFGARSCKKET